MRQWNSGKNELWRGGDKKNRPWGRHVSKMILFVEDDPDCLIKRQFLVAGILLTGQLISPESL